MGTDRQVARTSRTPGSASARRSFALHARSEQTGEPVEELRGRLAHERARDHRAGGGATRRELIVAAGIMAGGAALARSPAASLARRLARPGAPRVAIVGAGLAGLRCAHQLWRESPGEPIASTIYEANPDRAGGRCWTLRGYFADGLQTEHGGSFLNSNQTAVRQLAARLGLAGGGGERRRSAQRRGDLPDRRTAILRLAEAESDWAAFGYAAFKVAGRELRGEAGEARLDAMSVPEWLESTPIGSSSRFGRLMLANVVTENGGDPGDMSALDLIELLTGNPRSSLEPLPGDDETYHLVGGNDQLVSAHDRPAPTGNRSPRPRPRGNQGEPGPSVPLSFQTAGTSVEITADYVVLALPFSTLQAVDISHSGLSPAKRRVIRTMGMGTNARSTSKSPTSRGRRSG